MKRLYALTVFLILNLTVIKGQGLYFPTLSGASWDTTAPQSLGWCQPQIDSLYNYLAVKHSKSFIILKNGRLVLEKYFGSYTADSLFYWASASKSLASFITGIAQQKGFISINNTASQYLGNGWSSETAAKENLITVKHLLEMAGGFDDSPPAPCDNEDTAKACLTYLVDAGTRWAYHTGAYKKVQSVVSAAASQNYNLITNNWVEAHTGMSGVWIDQTYYSKARDMARFGLLNLNRGIWASDTVLKDAAYFNAMVNTSQTFNAAYGYLWWLNGKASYMSPGTQIHINGPLIPNAPADLFAALGKNDQKIYVVPSAGMVVIRQGYSANNVTFALSDFDNTLWDYINKLSCVTTVINEVRQAEVSVYPNPASDKIFISADLPLKTVSLSSSLGVLMSAPVSGNSMDVSALTTGIYFLKIVLANGQSLSRKITIN